MNPFPMPVTPTAVTIESKFGALVKSHFMNLRQRQQQNRDITTITQDILFCCQFLNDSVTRPVPILKMMGMIITNGQIAIQKDIFSHMFAIQNSSKIFSTLHRDGWITVDLIEKYDQQIVEMNPRFKGIISTNEAKEWTALEYPFDCEFSRCVFMNPRLIATKENINMMNDLEKTPIQTSDCVFPLVSIQYDRELKFFNVADFDARDNSNEDAQKHNLNYQFFGTIECRPPHK